MGIVYFSKECYHSAEMPLKVHRSLSWSFKVPRFDRSPSLSFLPPALKPLPMAGLSSSLPLQLCPPVSAGFWSVLRSLWVIWSDLYILMPQPLKLWYLLILLASLSGKRNPAIGDCCCSAPHWGCYERRRSRCEDVV